MNSSTHSTLPSILDAFVLGRRRYVTAAYLLSASSDGYQVPNNVDYYGQMGQSTSTMVTEESRSSPTPIVTEDRFKTHWNVFTKGKFLSFSHPTRNTHECLPAPTPHQDSFVS